MWTLAFSKWHGIILPSPCLTVRMRLMVKCSVQDGFSDPLHFPFKSNSFGLMCPHNSHSSIKILTYPCLENFKQTSVFFLENSGFLPSVSPCTLFHLNVHLMVDSLILKLVGSWMLKNVSPKFFGAYSREIPHHDHDAFIWWTSTIICLTVDWWRPNTL